MSTLTMLPTISAVELADSIVSMQLLPAQGTRSRNSTGRVRTRSALIGPWVGHSETPADSRIVGVSSPGVTGPGHPGGFRTRSPLCGRGRENSGPPADSRSGGVWSPGVTGSGHPGGFLGPPALVL